MSLKENFLKNGSESLVHLSCFIIEDILYVQSQKYLGGVSFLLVKIFEDLNFEMYHCGIKYTLTTLSKNRVMTVYVWSVFEEIIRYIKSMEISNNLKSMEIGNNKYVLQEHLSRMTPTVIGKKMYSQ